MKMLVKPFYGWGWYQSDPDCRIDVPPEFSIDVEIGTIKDTKVFIGQLPASSHPLSSLWLLLSKRHANDDNDYNLTAYQERPLTLNNLVQDIVTPSLIIGFAQVIKIAD